MGVALIAVLLLLRIVFWGGDGDQRANAGSAGAASTTTTSPSGRASTATPLATITPSPGSERPPGPGGGQEAGGSGNGSGGLGSGTSAGGTGGSAGGGPPACADSALRLTVETDQREYQVGDEPVIDLTLTNASTSACRRDVGSAEQEAVVSSGNDRIWSSNDCDPGGDPDPRVIDAGRSLHFSVTWTGLSSKPDCAGQRTRVGAGDYTLVVRIGSLHSDTVKFTLK